MVEHARWISHADPTGYEEDAFTRYIASRLAERVRGLAPAGAAERRVSCVLPPAGLGRLLEILGRPEDRAFAPVRTTNAGEGEVRYRVEITIRPETDRFQSPEEMHNGTTGNAMADDRPES